MQLPLLSLQPLLSLLSQLLLPLRSQLMLGTSLEDVG